MLSHKERHERRLAIRQAVEGGMSRQQAAEQWCVSLQTVSNACCGLPRAEPGRANMIEIVSYLLRGHSDSDVAQRLNIHPGRVRYVRALAARHQIALGEP